MKVAVEVTKDDIAKGEPQMPDQCAVARACERTFGRPVEVSKGVIRIKTDKGTWIEVYQPDDVVDFIYSYDRYGAAEPFTTQLDVPSFLWDWLSGDRIT